MGKINDEQIDLRYLLNKAKEEFSEYAKYAEQVLEERTTEIEKLRAYVATVGAELNRLKDILDNSINNENEAYRKIEHLATERAKAVKTLEMLANHPGVDLDAREIARQTLKEIRNGMAGPH